MTKNEVLGWLKKNGSRRTADGMARYGIVAPKAFGVTMGAMLKFAKQREKDHALAAALWKTGWYEARILASMLDDPKKVTAKQMDAWAAEFDNWGVCDTVCWHLFYETPFIWKKARQWSKSPREFVKRAGFVMMAGLVTHDRAASNAEFNSLFPLIEAGSRDERNFVKKGVSWALRRIGTRNLPLNVVATALAARLSKSERPASRWVGRDAHRYLSNPKGGLALARRAK